MDSLFNAFSVLELDAEDDQLQPASASAASGLDVSGSTATATATSGRSGELFCPGPGPIATQVARSLTMVGGDVLPEGVVLENHEKSVLMAMKTELLEVKEHINCLLSKVDSCLGSLGKSEEKIIGLDDKLLVENGKWCLSNPVTPSIEYKLPLVWIDLEMTGLNVEVDRILEIACIITDGKLTKTLEGPDLVIHQSKENLDRMGEWCQNHHAASGLTKKVLHSTTCEKEAEKQVMEFVKRNVGTYTPLLAGNSIYVDFLFLKKYMPDLAALFSHVLVDVSSVKALCMRWYPRDQKKAPSKENKHRAMDDIRESIMELKYYKENIFKASKSRK
ncbi:oligoribonuclease isoform X1 [Juglans regia]|uniref:Oligoribonuclease isoform X1 n=2 Tax=Juglans regia TaxID=51240 RepID=A0A2I4EHS4_JUGRE|nr:oligoribonuclease isoform X1 [Juglans regia]